MSLTFPYSTYSTNRPLWQLHGSMQRPQPMIEISVIGPLTEWRGRALLDTGSDDTVFPIQVARAIGIDLSNAFQITGTGIGHSAPIVLRFAEVGLRISDGVETREWLGRVGFTTAPLRRPLLGYAGFLQFFTATFDAEQGEVHLAVNQNYAGT